MKGLKAVVIVSLAVLLSIACSSSETAPTNTSPTPSASQSASTQAANTNPYSSAPTPTPTPTASIPNTNTATEVAAKPAEEKKEEKKEEKPAETKKVSGAAVYAAQKCAGCHGADGKGKVKNSPNFTDPAWQKKTSDAHMIAQIKNGKDPVMPGYAGKLNDAEIKALVGYIRSFAK